MGENSEITHLILIILYQNPDG